MSMSHGKHKKQVHIILFTYSQILTDNPILWETSVSSSTTALVLDVIKVSESVFWYSEQMVVGWGSPLPSCVCNTSCPTVAGAGTFVSGSHVRTVWSVWGHRREWRDSALHGVSWSWASNLAGVDPSSSNEQTVTQRRVKKQMFPYLKKTSSLFQHWMQRIPSNLAAPALNRVRL